MDKLNEKLKSLSNRVQKMKESITTEEATKTSVIMPFFQALEYDVFNPEEFLPEFVADVGIKKGEKVDYAILQNGSPIILIEAKAINEKLEKHDSQLFRYFGTTKAKFAILTNGIVYKFYTDLEEQNKMDSAPFFEFNLFDIRDNQVAELYKFRKDNFNVDDILTTASELKYTNEIKQFLSQQFENPSDEFVSFILSDFYQGKKTKQVLEKFNGLVKKSFKQLVNDLLNDKLKAAIATTNTEPVSTSVEEAATTVEKSDAPQIVTTEEELEGYITAKVLLKEIVSPERVNYRDNLSYFNILLDNSIRKWICRLGMNGPNKYVQFNDDDKTTYNINAPSDLMNHKDKLIEVTKKFL
ncbi:type I restriction endonuclease [Cohnella laeviribosi]|uniref:type I restriction endonuclease n=1 Tax=Cohnella laeviribosi TaxID=380174 RepID=UPI0003804C56|nr:type I restriction endonuclease [Cohnella laeviribosi]